MVQVFRRPASPMVSAKFKLHGLEPDGLYSVSNLDASGTNEMTGRELMEKGLLISLANQPDSAIISYKRLK